MWLETIHDLITHNATNKEITDKIQEHVDNILLDSTHALNDICIQFAHQFAGSYSRERIQSPSSSMYNEEQSHMRLHHQDTIRAVINQARTDISTFIEKLLQALFNKYWAYAFSRSDPQQDSEDDGCEQVVYNCILKHVFSIGVYSKLVQWYGRLYSHQNSSLNNKLKEFNQSHIGDRITLKHLRVKKLFRLDEDKNSGKAPYNSVINQLAKYDVHFMIEEKLALLSGVINQISIIVREYYKNDPNVLAEDTILGADDMLPIFVVSSFKTH